MKIKNTGEGTLNLVSGPCKKGSTGEATFEEFQFLVKQGRCIASVAKKKAVKTDG